MKTKINPKTLQVKLNRSIGIFVKSVTNTNSKKINKSIKKASRIIAKAVTKAITKKGAATILTKKFVSKKAKAIKHVKTKATKNSSPRAGKIKKTTPVKVAKKLKEVPVVTPEVKTKLETISPQ